MLLARGNTARPSIQRIRRSILAQLSARLLALLLTGLAIGVVLATLALLAWSSRAAAIEEARQRLSDRATTLGEHAGRLLDAVHLALLDVIAVPSGRSWDDVGKSVGDHLRLKQLSERLDYVSAFWLTDETGMPRATSRASQRLGSTRPIVNISYGRSKALPGRC